MRASQTVPASVPGPQMFSKQCKCLIVPWWHGQCPSCSCPSSVVYDANLSQDLRVAAASESRENFLQLFQSCGLSWSPLLITV